MAGTGPMAEGLAPLRARMPRAAIEREVLRVAADLAAADPAAFAEARRQALAWAEARAGGRLPPAAWEGAAFEHLAGRVVLAPAARRMVKDAAFVDVAVAARCLLWLARPCLRARIAGGQPLDGARVAPGIHNARCGGDTFSFDFRGARLVADWHVKTGGNTRAPERCLRIYYGFDPARRQIVVAEMPAHRRTGAS